MSDKLKWMNRHFVLLRHKSLDDVCNIEGYKIRPDLLSFFADRTDAEEIVWKFADAGRWKCACELMAYMAHRRAAVWWVYRCVLSLYEELQEAPAEERDINSIATSFDPTVPDFAKVEPVKADPKDIQDAKEMLSQIEQQIASLREIVDPAVMADVDEAVNYAFELFKEKHGVTPIELVKIALEKEKEPMRIDPDSPIFKAADSIKAQLMAVRQETLDTIHAVIPPKVPEHEKKMSDDAMRAVYRWIVSPDEVNSKKAMDIGNECTDTPAGLLALCAFWAGGNLMPDPEKDQVVPTPNGLAANGLSQVLLMCALHKGGTRKLKERYEHYFNLGVEVLTGKNNWDKSVVEGEAPHDADDDDAEETEAEIEEQKQPEKPAKTERPEKTESATTEKAADKKNAPVVYKRWKPTNGG